MAYRAEIVNVDRVKYGGNPVFFPFFVWNLQINSGKISPSCGNHRNFRNATTTTSRPIKMITHTNFYAMQLFKAMEARNSEATVRQLVFSGGQQDL